MDYDYRQQHRASCAEARARGFAKSPVAAADADLLARARGLHRDWVVSLDITADERHGAEQVKRASGVPSSSVTRVIADPAPPGNPSGPARLAEGAPQRISSTGANGVWRLLAQHLPRAPRETP